MHLDSEYRRRWELYHTSDGIYDSREINWKQIPRDKVTQIEAHVESQVYSVYASQGSLIRWRFGGQEWVDGVFHKINTWCIGWTDGVTCFIKEIEFKDGSMTEREYPYDQFKKHLL